jgi:hypothetical protein
MKISVLLSLLDIRQVFLNRGSAPITNGKTQKTRSSYPCPLPDGNP